MRFPKQLITAIALAFFSAQVASALYVRTNTEAAADAMQRGTLLGEVLVWSLLNVDSPNRSELTNPTVSHGVYTARLRDSANLRLIWDIPSLFIVGLIVLAARLWRRLGYHDIRNEDLEL